MAGTAAETPQQALVFWTMFYKVGITLNHLRSEMKLFGLFDIIIKHTPLYLVTKY